MHLRRIALVLTILSAFPGGASAGLIEFTLSTDNITTSPGAPALGMTLTPFQSPGSVFTFDPASGLPVTLPAVSANPVLIPTPAPRDIHPDGTTHWNNDGYFGVDVSLTDLASGQTAVVRLNGRAHMYNNYSVSDGWSGTTYFWFQDVSYFTLGGNNYTVWGANQYSEGPARVNVWVGSDAPVHATPEPTTLALAALGFIPLAFRRLRR